MIQSLFDSEDEKNEGEKIKTQIVETPKTEIPTENKISENVETQQLPAVDTSETNSVSSFENENREVLENPQEIIETPNFEPIDDFESENVVKEIEFGDNFLELEKELNKIEEEVRLESADKLTEEKKAENLSAVENKIEPKQSQQGIFTSALNKAQQEKKSAVPLENLLFVPNETQAEFEERVSENQADEPNLTDENQGFILPNRVVEPNPENSVSNKSNEVFQSDYEPQSKSQIIRNSGLAWSAGIAFFGSVVFLLILGWFADLLLGTSPWLAVGGVVLGSIVGFLQLFRLTSQILKDNE